MFDRNSEIKALLEQQHREFQACTMRIRDLMNRNLQGILIVKTNRIISFANPAAAAIFDCKPEELLGKPFDFSFELNQKTEIKVKSRKGQIVEAEMWVVDTLWDAEQAYFVSLQDVTERNRNEHELRKLYHAITESPVMVMITNALGNIEYVNPRFTEITGYTVAEVVGKNPRILKSDQTSPEVYELLWQAIANGRDWRGEFVNRKKNGEIYYESASIAPVMDFDGVITNFVAVKQDITERKKIEEAFRESQRALSTLMSNLPGMAYRCRNDRDWTMEFVSEGCFELTGHQQDGLVQNRETSYAELIHPDDRESVWDDVQAALLEKMPFKLVYRISTADGVEKWVWEQGRGIFGPDGELLALEGFITDITERKRMEAELEHFASFPLLNPNPVIELDHDGKVTFCNTAAGIVLGQAECFDSRNPFIPGDLQDILLDLHQGKIHQFARTAEIGSRVFDELIALTPQFKSVRIYAVDVTERNLAEQKLQESEERFRAIFEQAAVGIGEVGPDRRWLRVNRKLCEITGYTEEELRALPIEVITHPDDQEKSLRQLQLLLEAKLSKYFLEKRYIRKDGSTVWVNLTASAVFDAIGNLKFTVGILEDITNRKRAEAEIERLNSDLSERAAELSLANQELEAFNYTVAHDLRKPLTVVNGYCQALKELCGDQLNPHCREYLQEAYDGTWRMNRLIEALLKFSSLAHVELRMETVDLSGMAQEVAAELKLAEPERRVEFRIAGGVSVDGDAALLRVLLDNLLGNAWKYTGMRDEGIIEFGTIEVDGKPTCFVRDNGAGFAMADADKIFLPFQRLPGAEEFRGHGIGLATVERIIRRHGGKIWAEGERGKGATLYFTLSNGRD